MDMLLVDVLQIYFLLNKIYFGFWSRPGPRLSISRLFYVLSKAKRELGSFKLIVKHGSMVGLQICIL